MKAYRLSITAALVCMLAVTVICVMPDGPAHANGYGTLAVVAIAALRKDHADVLARAAAKIAELTDGLSVEQVRAIEDDHKKLVDQAGELQRQIDAAEAEARSQPGAHAWPAEDIRRINARAAAFGLDASVAIEVMADPKFRTLEAVTDELQSRAVARNGQTPRQQPQVQLQRDAVDTVNAAVADAILLRANPTAIAGDDRATQDRLARAREWRGMSLLEIGRAYMFEAHGVKLRGVGPLDLAGQLLGLQPMGRAAGLGSTSDFANVLANVMSKRLRDAYQVAPQNWKLLGRQSNAPDFKQKSVVQLSSAPTFKQVREGAEFQYGGMTDGVEKYALATYGRIIAISRQTLINDDLSAFDRLPMMLGRQAAELEASTFWSVITANANMNDGVALFHSTHGNLAGSGTAIDTTNLGLARAAMRKQKGLAAKAADAEPLNLTPRFLVVSPDKETEAQQALTAVLAAQSSTVNVFANSLQQITEARLTGNAWYLFSDPALIDTIEYAYLDGEEGLYVEQRQGFEVDGLEIKARVDFAAKAIDWRGMYKNPGN